MSFHRMAIRVALLSLVFLAPVKADTLTVFAAGAVKGAVETLIPSFEAESGHKVTLVVDTVGALASRLDAGEKADIVMLAVPVLEQLEARHRFKSLEVAELGRTGVGLAVKTGAAIPSIKTEGELRAALEAAASIGYADPARGATAGTQFQQALTKLGLAEPLAGKLRVFPVGTAVVDAVAVGEIAIGVSQATEITGHAGVTFAGLLPNSLQRWVVYRAARLSDSPAARAFLDHIADDDNMKAFAKIGLRL